MTEILYVSDSVRQSIDFINGFISDLREFGIENIEHDRRNNSISVGNMEIRGISIYENCLCLKIHNPKYFIDGIDMRNYKNASEERLDNLISCVKEVLIHFCEDTNQLDGKDELIKILKRMRY